MLQCWKGQFTSTEHPQLLINRGLRLEISHWNQDHLIIEHHLTSSDTHVLFTIPLHRPDLWPLDIVLYCTSDFRWILTRWTGLDFEDQEFLGPGFDEVFSEDSKQRIDGFINTSVQWSEVKGLLIVQFRHGWIVSIYIEVETEGFPNLKFDELNLSHDLERNIETSNLTSNLVDEYWQNCIILQMELFYNSTDFRLLFLTKMTDYIDDEGTYRIVEINIDQNFRNSIIRILE